MTKEVLHHRVIIAVSLPAHALLNSFLGQHPTMLLMMVVPALVLM